MAKYIVNADIPVSKIDRGIYGHFSEHLGRCIYEGLFVGEDSPIPNRNGMRIDVIDALKKVNMPVLRWPGGCFADTYHWKDGIGPRAGRKKIVNVHWGGMVEDNSFGTHEFFELCSQLGCEPYINGNVGSGTVQEMQEWVEYIGSSGVSPMADLRRKNGREEPWKIKYWGVGNENWGCGGGMRPEFYADLFRQFCTYLYTFGENKPYKIACGPNRDDYEWTRVLMQRAAQFMDALTLHYYSYNKKNRSATEFGEYEWAEMLADANGIEAVIARHSAIMDEYDPDGRVALIVDEWGSWHNVEPGTTPGFLYQQNTMRDAVLAGLSLNIFNRHSRRIRMSNIAQLVNVLQSLVLTDGARMTLTPTYHVFDLFKGHQDATLVHAHIDCGDYVCEGFTLPRVSQSASRAEDGSLTLTLVNLDPANSESIVCDVRGMQVTGVSAQMLAAPMTAYNDFDNAERVKPVDCPVTADGNLLIVTLPAGSVASLCVR